MLTSGGTKGASREAGAAPPLSLWHQYHARAVTRTMR